MRYRSIAVLLFTLLLIAGAMHHAPLWLFVFAAPLWLHKVFTWEAARVRAEAKEALRDAVLRTPVDKDEG